MAKNEDAPAEHIIIVRRRGGAEEDHHHGGSWKIAYADFMTAMMALFLVMWLVNASNTETRASIAAYFSPIKLTDTVARTKGLQDFVPKASETGQHKDASAAAPKAGKGEAEKKEPSGKPKANGAGAAADKISGETDRLAIVSEGAAAALTRETDAARAGVASETGHAFRDPFHPGMAAAVASKEGIGKSSAAAAAASVIEGQKSVSGITRASPGDSPGLSVMADAARPAGYVHEVASTDGATKVKAEPAAGATDATRQGEAEGRTLAKAAERLLQNVQGAVGLLGNKGGPEIEVKVEDNAIVLSLTDTSTFGMFDIGSADPNEALVKLMQSIAPAMTANGERIVVRGHTDGRQYRTNSSNNWRLSMSRAESTLALLVRSGIDENRFERIEAHADRNLKVPTNPEAAGNRRIEIVLRQAAK